MDKVKDYLRKVKSVYWEKSGEVEKQYNELKKLDAERNQVMTSRDFTPEGRQKRLAAIDAKRDALKSSLVALRVEANNEAGKIRQDAERAFYKYYNASPDDVDLKMTELIRSGVLSDAELIHYGEKANATMRRLIGKELSTRQSREARQAASVFQMLTTNPHLQAIDSIMEIGDYAVGGARLGGLDTVSSIRERYDGLVDPVIDKVSDVKTEYLADGTQRFSVEGTAGYDS